MNTSPGPAPRRIHETARVSSREIPGRVTREARQADALCGQIAAVREQRRRLGERVSRIEADIRDQQLQFRAGLDRAAAAQLKQLQQQRQVHAAQIAAAERAEAETHEKLHQMVAFSAPLQQTLEAVLRFVRVSREDLGIPYGVELPRSVQADITLTEGP